MSITGIDVRAPVIARHSTVIASPVETLWRLHADVNAWPTWQTAIDRAHLADPFQPGAAFTWETYHLTIVSTVYQVEPHQHSLWGGPSDGITGIHSWTFNQTDDGVRVDTEESWTGAAVTADVPGMQAARQPRAAGRGKLRGAAAK